MRQLLIVVVFLVFWGAYHLSKGKSKKEIVKVSTCKGSKEYNDGLSYGETARLYGGGGTCEMLVKDYNFATGREILKATECFCEGYNDGLYPKSK